MSTKVRKYPANYLRLVLQVVDTLDNRKAIKKARLAVKMVGIPDDEHAVLKVEQITIVTMESTTNPNKK